MVLLDATRSLISAMTLLAWPILLEISLVAAVCSVTDDPPMLLVCLNRGSPQNRLFKDNGVLCVNCLAAGLLLRLAHEQRLGGAR